MAILSEEVIERTRGTPHAMRKPKIEPLPPGTRSPPRHVPVKKLKGNRPKERRPKPVVTNRREESEEDEAEPSSRARVAGGHKVWQEGSDKLNMQVFKGKFPWRAPHVETYCTLGICCSLGRAAARHPCLLGRAWLALGGGAPHSGGAAVPPRAQWEAKARAPASAKVVFRSTSTTGRYPAAQPLHRNRRGGRDDHAARGGGGGAAAGRLRAGAARTPARDPHRGDAEGTRQLGARHLLVTSDVTGSVGHTV